MNWGFSKEILLGVLSWWSVAREPRNAISIVTVGQTGRRIDVCIGVVLRPGRATRPAELYVCRYTDIAVVTSE